LFIKGFRISFNRLDALLRTSQKKEECDRKKDNPFDQYLLFHREDLSKKPYNYDRKGFGCQHKNPSRQGIGQVFVMPV
jgi:hypothetical protein